MLKIENRIIQSIFRIFSQAGKSVYLVGGSVRDLLMEKPLNDYDFATSATPSEIIKILRNSRIKTYPVGINFGTVGAFIDKVELHITTFRKKEIYRGISRKPDVDFGSNIMEDLERRDFTINTIAIGAADSKIIDPFKGREDLEQKLIRTPKNPDTAFADDSLRILRALRFQSQLGFEIEEKTRSSLKKNAYRLLNLSSERIRDEMTKLLLGNHLELALENLMKNEVINYFIPELVPLKNLHEDSQLHHKDVWMHTVKVVKNCPLDEKIRWTALLHDIAKPYVRTIDEKNVHFYRHEDLGAKMAWGILTRLRFSNQDRKHICFLIRKHMRANLYTSLWTDTAVRRFATKMGDKLSDILSISKADITSYKKERVRKKLEELSELEGRCEELISAKESKFPITGDELMDKFNLSPSPLIGKMKHKILEAITNETLPENSENKELYFEYIKKAFKKELEI
ncbi:CCA tRNA nucleotidyltransferase [bacterium]|nr:CCA tRNA nucleotidyltransferase [bacterium]